MCNICLAFCAHVSSGGRACTQSHGHQTVRVFYGEIYIICSKNINSQYKVKVNFKLCLSACCLQHNADVLHLNMDDIQADILRSNKVNISCGELTNLERHN